MRYNAPGAVSAESYGRLEGARASSRTFMNRVYGWMTAGLAVTAGTAFAIATTPAVLHAVMPLMWPIFFLQLALVFGFSFMSQRVSPAVAGLLFMAYALTNGVVFSTLALRYTGASIAGAFLSTGLTFGALSVYGTVTKKDLSAWGTFLFMGLVGVFVASIVNVFLGSGMLSFVLGCAGVLVFAGLTAYDTQKLRSMHAQWGDRGNLAINGALQLYLDFINLFISLLRLFGDRR
jgi:FtsH-binding integral membrane protein